MATVTSPPSSGSGGSIGPLKRIRVQGQWERQQRPTLKKNTYTGALTLDSSELIIFDMGVFLDICTTQPVLRGYFRHFFTFPSSPICTPRKPYTPTNRYLHPARPIGPTTLSPAIPTHSDLLPQSSN